MEEVYKFKTKPYQHQYDGWNISKRNKYFALLMDLGTGKTKVTLDTAAYMFDNGWINALMVFGNNGSYTNWVEGVTEHLPSHIPYKIGVWSSKNSKKQMNEMYKAITAPGLVLRIFLMNIEAIAFPRGFEAAMNFVKSNNTLAVVDESTTIANPKALRTKAAWKIGAAARARRILTGSAVDNKPLDAWAQFQFLANGALGFTSYYAFRAQYADLEEMTIKQKGITRTFKSVSSYKNLDKLKESISKISFIVKKEDCLDLPPKTFMNYYVDLTPEQEKLYEQLRKRSIAEISQITNVPADKMEQKFMSEALQTLKEYGVEGIQIGSKIYAEEGDKVYKSSIVSVKLMITKMLRLHQLVCGHLRDDDGVIHDIPTNRLKALDDILEETRGKVVIWTSFTPDVKAIYKHIREKYGPQSVLTYYGETSNEERARVKEVFKRGREVDEIRFLIANDKTGGYGNNFTAITTSIYYCYDFDFNVHHQTQDRIHRIGQTDPVTYIYLVCRNTIDEKIISVLKNKKSISDLLTQSNWKEWI